MCMTVAIVGEGWEARFARATAISFADWLPADAEVWIPSEFAHAISDLGARPWRVLSAARPGFQDYEAVRQRVLREADKDRGLLLLAAGTLPAARRPLECLGASWRQTRAVEWLAPTEGGPASVLHFQPPPHRPPARPLHSVEKVGALDVWTIDGGRNYFQALAGLDGAGGPPIWTQYGTQRPVFVYNTNNFDEPPVAAHEEYFILGSGLLGLRMIVESRPTAGARVVVYDINPGQLLWVRFVLKVSGQVEEFEEVVKLFRAEHPLVEVRPVLTHEAANAERQAAWYRSNRHRIGEIGASLEWEYRECDLWNEPSALLSRIRAARSLFFMYLDLFMVWHVESELPWVEHHAGAALSLEEAVRSQARGGAVTFLPGARSARFQLQPGSPFASKDEE
jgi:hypothetical protein